jgi:hypothetical protein
MKEVREMAGWMYRRALDLKDFGARHNLPWLRRLGLALQEKLKKCPRRYF